MWKRKQRRIVVALFVIALAVFLLVFIVNRMVTIKVQPNLYDDWQNIPYNKVGLVLGTSKYLADGRPNLYFKYRIDAAAKLYRYGKIKYIVVSGDNHAKEYNEPQQMKDDLVAKGIPANAIYLDYAGFRTLDSVVRMDRIFGQTSFTVISQRFHNERAVYIARKNGLDAVAYNATDVSKSVGLKTRVRELFARVKMFVDFVIDKQPKFLGESVIIE